MCEAALFFYLSLWRVFHHTPAPCGIHGPFFFSAWICFVYVWWIYVAFPCVLLYFHDKKEKKLLCVRIWWQCENWVPSLQLMLDPFHRVSLWIMKYMKVWDITKRAAQARLSGCQENKMWGESSVQEEQEWRTIEQTEKGLLEESKIHKLWNPVSIQICHISEPDLLKFVNLFF